MVRARSACRDRADVGTSLRAQPRLVYRLALFAQPICSGSKNRERSAGKRAAAKTKTPSEADQEESTSGGGSSDVKII